MAEFELGIYANPFAPESVTKRIRGILRSSPEGPTFYLTIPPTYQYRPIPKRVVVAGGEGSIRTVVQMMYDRKVVRPVGLLPGGSQNVLYHALMDLGLKASIKTFLEKTLDDYPEDQILRPGMINEMVFINHAGLGSFEQYLGRWNERLRFLPNGLRNLVAPSNALVLAVWDTMTDRKEFFNLYGITLQELLSNTLTHVWSVRLIERRQLQRSCFEDETKGNALCLDGDTLPYPQQQVLIKRAPYGIPVVAIT